MSNKNAIAAHITLHPLQAAIRKYPGRHGASYSVAFANYFKDERGEGWEQLEDVSEQDLHVLAKIVQLVQAEIIKLRQADGASANSPDAN